MSTKDAAYYAANKEKIKERSAAWYAANKGRALESQRARRLANPDAVREYQQAHYRANRDRYIARTKAWREANPDLYRLLVRADNAVRRAVRSGRLVKPTTCEACGGTNRQITAAHWDYDKPLDVKWLCRSCHAQWDHAMPKLYRGGGRVETPTEASVFKALGLPYLDPSERRLPLPRPAASPSAGARVVGAS